MTLIRRTLFALIVLLFAQPIHAADFGTAQEAKAMLEKVVAAITANKAKALEDITKGANGFKDRDLYPYCGGPDGMFTAHPTLVGKSLKGLMDKGTPPKPLGEEIYAKATTGKISEVEYMWPRPGDAEQKPVKKIVYVTKVDDQVCAVGYYP